MGCQSRPVDIAHISSELTRVLRTDDEQVRTAANACDDFIRTHSHMGRRGPHQRQVICVSDRLGRKDSNLNGVTATRTDEEFSVWIAAAFRVRTNSSRKSVRPIQRATVAAIAPISRILIRSGLLLGARTSRLFLRGWAIGRRTEKEVPPVAKFHARAACDFSLVT